MGEAAPVGDRVGYLIGHLKGRVQVRDDLGGGVGSGNPTQSSPVSKMRPRPRETILQTLVQRGVR